MVPAPAAACERSGPPACLRKRALPDLSKPAPIDFRAVIRAAMDADGITQTELAKRTGLTQSRISQYLSGQRDMQGANIALMLTSLGVAIR